MNKAEKIAPFFIFLFLNLGSFTESNWTTHRQQTTGNQRRQVQTTDRATSNDSIRSLTTNDPHMTDTRTTTNGKGQARRTIQPNVGLTRSRSVASLCNLLMSIISVDCVRKSLFRAKTLNAPAGKDEDSDQSYFPVIKKPHRNWGHR